MRFQFSPGLCMNVARICLGFALRLSCMSVICYFGEILPSISLRV